MLPAASVDDLFWLEELGEVVLVHIAIGEPHLK